MSMDTAWTLVFIGLLLMSLELFVPGGVLGIIGLICFMGAVIGIWMDYGTIWGLTAFLCALVLTIGVVIIEMALLRRSPLASRFFLINKNPDTANNPPAAPDYTGRTGEALTTMAPTGIVLIDGQRVEAASQDGLLHKGTPIRVVGRDTFRVIVRKTELN